MKDLVGAFNSFCIYHIFREKNEQANSLSKKGLHMPTRIIIYTVKKMVLLKKEDPCWTQFEEIYI